MPFAGRPLASALVVYAASCVAIMVLWAAAALVPFLAANLGAFVTLIFLYFPYAAVRRRGEDLGDYGFSLRPLGRGLAFAGGVLVVIFPLFLVGFVAYYRTVCAPGQTETLAALAPPGLCHLFLGWAGLAHPRVGIDFWEQALTQVVVVAVPEELFFRGYLLARLEEAFPPRRRFLGGGVGLGLVLAAALFAVAHVLVDFDPRRLAVFFPGLLFGWMRSATGSILAGSVVHAASNLYIDALHRTFFR